MVMILTYLTASPLTHQHKKGTKSRADQGRKIWGKLLEEEESGRQLCSPLQHQCCTGKRRLGKQFTTGISPIIELLRGLLRIYTNTFIQTGKMLAA